MGNGSEWYLARLMDKGTYRPLSGHAETKKYHVEHYGELDYYDFADEFTAEHWDPDSWMTLAKEAGASYVILTAKHHDGYCLWDTATTPRNSVACGSHRDLLGEFRDSAVAHGLQFGIYYSWSEFGKNMTGAYLNDTLIPQIGELEKYKPDIWWFDGHWAIKTQMAISAINRIVLRLKAAPSIVNDRIPDPAMSSYRVYEDRHLPKVAPEGPWEHINTIGASWGANRAATTYKSGAALLKLYQSVTEYDGRFLINLGPLADGTLLPGEIASLQAFAKLKMTTDQQ